MRSQPRTRRFLLFTAFLLVLSPSETVILADSPQTDDGSVASEPFVVFVAQEEAYTRCGPSNEFYRTDPLRYGQELEVYVETVDGWLGVRPPENSFCWIPADDVELSSDGETAVVIEDGTVSWIGTHLGRARQYRWQVQLAKGEPITIIGRSEREGPDGPRLWFRTVPPSGEFRWVHSNQVVPNAEALVAAVREQTTNEIEFLPGEKTIAKPNRPRMADRVADTEPIDDFDKIRTASNNQTKESSRRRERNTELEPIAYDDIPRLKSAPLPAGQTHPNLNQPIGSGLRPSAPVTHSSSAQETTLAQPSLASAEFIGRPRIKDIDEDVRQMSDSLLDSTVGNASAAPSDLAQANDSNWVIGSKRDRGQYPVAQVSGIAPVAHPTLAVARIESEVQNQTVEQLNLTFSRMMAASASSAELAPLANRARQLVSSQGDQVVAGRARLLADRIEQYRSIADRREGSGVVQAAATEYQPPTIPSPAQPREIPTPPNLAVQTGFLVQVYSARKDSPPFALTDNQGRTIAYASPSPGVNLRMHLNSEIQVRGVQTYLRGLNTPHLIVSEVSRNIQ
ncbi:hypothetical protein Q31b_53770 [Novipirellula aureliae]|uniref:Secreted protein n=1 Tax=Novipirellula aureliae TaxID=2527966 RepID=A0A5C6DHT3_9BACT|nr:hypothetical protein [Novipirellula aureliae]TWU35281.1 hypothetical protein Q31b_53770 [Novipirellula aureliae]